MPPCQNPPTCRAGGGTAHGHPIPERHGAREWLLGAALLILAWLPTAVACAACLGVTLFWHPDGSVLAPLLLFWFGVFGAVARKRGPLPGRVVRPDDEPELAALVRDVAARLGFRAPLLVRIVPEVQASVGRVRVAGVRSHVLLLGLPLLRNLTERELASVVAHELAHERRERGHCAALLSYAHARLADRLDRRFRPLAPPAAPLLRASQRYLWRTETAADAGAAEVAGTEATASALERTVTLHSVFECLAEPWLSELAERDAWPKDFYDALDTAFADPHMAARAARTAAEDDAVDPYATADHPPLAIRLAALPTRAGTGTYGAAPVALRTGPEIARWCTRRLALQNGEEENDVQPVRLLALPPEELRELNDAPGTAPLFRATGTDTPAAAVATALDTLADGSWQRLARRLEPRLRRAPAAVRGQLARRVFTAAVAEALAETLETSRWTPATRWTTTVLTSPDGRRTVDLRALVADAVTAADPAVPRALLKETPA
ncbi:M48 family metalloprotease [Streptomyces sp. NPDC002588]|uniref:M48 family metalloprotease n=1 Tax=Streptomyces sp. NPDC002588 TaxID=3154419 RepID=UPI00331EB656